MRWDFKHLDKATRELMSEEVEMDIAANAYCRSKRFTPAGLASWPGFLRDAARTGTPDTLAQALAADGVFVPEEAARRPKGGYSTKDVREDANVVLADDQFNRYYIRAVCKLAMSKGVAQLEVYRAKLVAEPRLTPDPRLQHRPSPRELLADVRATMSTRPTMGIPSGAGSGISVHIP